MKLLLAILLLLGAAPATVGQAAFAAKEQAIPLTAWKYRAADDPRFAEPNFDDSAWKQFGASGPAGPIEAGFVWFRASASIASLGSAGDLDLLIAPIAPAYELFVNGVRFGQFGGPPGSFWGQMVPEPRVFSIPSSLAASDGSMRIAIRAWYACRPWGLYQPDFSAVSWLGSAGAIQDKVAAWELNYLSRRLPLYLMYAGITLAALFFMAVRLWRPDTPEYFWFGAWLLLACLVRLIQLSPHAFGGLSATALSYLQALVSFPYLFAWVWFLQGLFRAKAGLAVRLSVLAALGTNVVGTAINSWVPTLSPRLQPALYLIFISGAAAIYISMAAGTEGRRTVMRPIHVSVALYLAVNLIVSIEQGLRANGGGSAALGVLIDGAIEPRSAAQFAFTLAMAVLLNQRSGRLLKERERLKQEFAAAREVQTLLLASGDGSVPEYRTESVYLPASEVGGDFYQIAPLADGGLLAIVGDVSGKGLKAAMTVSLIVGALRREGSRSPREIMENLNRVLTGGSRHGFVTCCCARLAANGEVLLANAGHIPPWRHGEELEVEPSLPLGVTHDLTIEERAFFIAAGEQLTFVSDGVIEAAGANGELFGFERTRKISGKSAQAIAEAARAWGQTDDITVVTIRRSA